MNLPRRMGYGTVTIVAELHLDLAESTMPYGGVNVFLDTSTADVTSSVANPPVEGARFSWNWTRIDEVTGYPTAYDGVGYFLARSSLPAARRNSSASDGLIQTNGTGDGRFGTQSFEQSSMVTTLTITYTPEDPNTTAREERVTFSFSPGGSANTFVWAPGDSNGEPSSDVPLGSVLRLGVTAWSSTYTFHPSTTDVTIGARVRTTLYLERFVAPSGPGSPTHEPYSTVDQETLCIGR